MSRMAVRLLVPAIRDHQPVIVQGSVLELSTPLSLWGGLDPRTGEVIDRRHPQSGQIVTDTMLFLPIGRGSSSASSILLEAVKRSTAPAAFVLREVDGILALGAAVAQQLYGSSPAIVVLDDQSYEAAVRSPTVSLEPANAEDGLPVSRGTLICGGS